MRTGVTMYKLISLLVIALGAGTAQADCTVYTRTKVVQLSGIATYYDCFEQGCDDSNDVLVSCAAGPTGQYEFPIAAVTIRNVRRMANNKCRSCQNLDFSIASQTGVYDASVSATCIAVP